jgi:lysyl-tRNA synthetase class 2
MSHALSDQELVRREALQKLRALGIDPFPAAEFPVTHHAAQVKEQFKEVGHAPEGAQPDASVVMAGRLMSVRVMGKASFAVIRDASGDQQIYINRDEIAPGEDKTVYNEVFKKLLHLGDFIGVRGFAFRTQTGELTLHVKELTVLAKSLRPLPVVKTDEQGNVHDAFTDPELRYRMRYVDLIVNPGVKETFLKRTRIFNAMRTAFQEAGYHGSGYPRAPAHSRRCGGASVRHAPQRAGCALLPAHRQ